MEGAVFRVIGVFRKGGKIRNILLNQGGFGRPFFMPCTGGVLPLELARI
jgi:hypothetical protein